MSELSELFARDPLSLTTEDIRTIIERYRQAQAAFELGVKTPKETKKRATKASGLLADLGLTEPEKKSSSDLLKDLGL